MTPTAAEAMQQLTEQVNYHYRKNYYDSHAGDMDAPAFMVKRLLAVASAADEFLRETVNPSPSDPARPGAHPEFTHRLLVAANTLAEALYKLGRPEDEA